MEALFAYFDQFLRLPADAQEALRERSTVLEVQRNRLIQPIGHTCKTIYFLESGIARIFYFLDGNDITEHFALPNEVVVRVESLFTGRPSLKGIQALEDCKLVAIDVTDLTALYNQHPSIERLFRLVFEDGYVRTINRIESLQFQTAEERYRALLEATDLVNRIPLKHIASYLGITQVSLSRIRANLRR